MHAAGRRPHYDDWTVLVRRWGPSGATQIHTVGGTFAAWRGLHGRVAYHPYQRSCLDQVPTLWCGVIYRSMAGFCRWASRYYGALRPIAPRSSFTSNLKGARQGSVSAMRLHRLHSESPPAAALSPGHLATREPREATPESISESLTAIRHCEGRPEFIGSLVGRRWVGVIVSSSFVNAQPPVAEIKGKTGCDGACSPLSSADPAAKSPAPS
jgi:hypothetical protein